MRKLSYFLILLVTCSVVGFILSAAPKEPEKFVCGTVDMDKVNKEYKALVESEAEFREFCDERLRKLDNVVKTFLLTDDERQELAQLESKINLTDQEKERLQELRDLSKKKEEELGNLEELEKSGKLTAEQKKRLTELSNLGTQRTNELARLRQSIDKEIQEKRTELLGELDKRMKAAIAEVAKAKGISIVIRADFLLYGGVDITDDVLAKLNP